MKLSEWTFNAMQEAVALIAFWLCAGLFVVAVLFILYALLNWFWGEISWRITVWRGNRNERKFNERALRSKKASTGRRATGTH